MVAKGGGGHGAGEQKDMGVAIKEQSEVSLW